MPRKPEEYARSQIVKSVNHWPHAWLELREGREFYAISPVANVYAALNGVRNLLARRNHHDALYDFNQQYGTVAAPQLGNEGRALTQESGKPDLFTCLLDLDGRPISVALEVKAFIGKFALGGSNSLWRENQREWMHKTTFGYGYWIFLWSLPEPVPKTGLRKKQKETMKAWLIPGLIWERKEQVYYNNVKQHTIHLSLENVRVKAALRNAGMTVDDLFGLYELKWEKERWWLTEKHPMTYVLDVGQPLGAACAMAGDPDAKYAFPPSNKKPREEIDGTADK